MTHKKKNEHYNEVLLTDNNSENIKQVLSCHKNVLICGIKGVGKITNTVKAVKDLTNVSYIGNPFDYEGKRRPGSYEKYIAYILSLKKDLKIIEAIPALFEVQDPIILIIDEIFGRNETEMAHISRLFEMENIQVIQIVGCLKNMGSLITKVHYILDLHHDGAFAVDSELAKAICTIFSRK